MDEKTEELRDIFLEVAEEETVTEAQREQRGSLSDRGDVDEHLLEVVGEMRERYGFDTDLDDGDLVTLVKAFYDSERDADIARRLDVSRRTAVRTRLELHLVRDRDRDAPFDVEEAARRRSEGATMAELAAAYDVSASTVRRYLRVFKADRRSRQANQRFRDAFDTALADADLSTRMTREIHEDGLDEATEGLETNVSF